MPSIFEKLGAIDRPYIPVSLTVGKQDVPVMCRKPSAYEQDAIDALYADEYSRILKLKVEATEGKISERERVRSVYRTRSKKDIVDQLLPTRYIDIRNLALESIDVDMVAESEKMAVMGDDERKEYVDLRDAEFEAARKAASKTVAEELMLEDFDDLVARLVEININIQVQTSAMKFVNAQYLYFTIYSKNEDGEAGERAFDSIEDVMNWTTDTIEKKANEVRAALAAGDLPLESPSAPAPSEPTTSPSDSAAASADSGTPTEAIPAS